MNNLNFFLGYPVPFKNICSVYPPKVKDVLSNQRYPVYYKLLTTSQEEIEDEWVKNGLDMKTLLTPLEYLLNGCYNDPSFRTLTEEAFEFFTHEPVIFLYEQKQIIIGNLEKIETPQNLKFISHEDFFNFQNLVRDSVGDKMLDPPVENENPRIKQMKAKARYRDKIKAKQGKGLNLLTTLSSICCMDYGLNPLNIGELSYASLPILVQVYQEKEKYHIDVRSLQAGADKRKVQAKYWIRNLDD